MCYAEYKKCTLCPRKCGVDRELYAGVCGEKNEVRIGRAAPHYWEEPCISGENGSGTVFFAGCSLKCVYCQNRALSRGEKGKPVSVEELAECYIELQQQGVHNINLVTAEHFAPHIKQSVLRAKEKGLNIPVILNSSGYVSPETLDLLKDVIDIYLVDFKYMDSAVAKEFSLASDYPKIAKEAIKKMWGFKGKPCYGEDSMLKSGVVVRHLCLPGFVADSKKILKYVFDEYGTDVILSIMSQYTPMPECSQHPLLQRKLTQKEYDEIIDYCIEIGIEDAYVQDGESASESFIPEFYGK